MLPEGSPGVGTRMKTPAIGIDFGSGQLSAAVWQDGRVEVIQDENGNKEIPALVAFTPEGILIGEAAEKQTAINVRNTIFDPKRLLGRDMHDVSLHEDLKRWPYTVVHESGRPRVEVDHQGERRRYLAEEVGALLLGRVKELAEAALGVPVGQVVLSVPANFCDAQRQAVLDSAAIAGLKVLQLVNEPTAAALALQRDFKGPRTLLVFDMGAGSLDASVVRLEREGVEVRGTSGTVHLGGRDFDARLVGHLVTEFRERHGRDLRASPTALHRLRAACREAKHALCDADGASAHLIELDALHEGVDLRHRLSKAKFDELCRDLFVAALEPVRRALSQAKITERDVDNVLMIGGASRMPQLRRMLRQMFEGREVLVDHVELVARGAAIQAAILSGQHGPLEVHEVAPWSISVETPNGLDFEAVQHNAAVPCRNQLTLSVGHPCAFRLPSLRLYEEDRNGNKNLVGSLKVGATQSSLSISIEVDPSGVLQVHSKDGEFRKLNVLTPLELQKAKTEFDRLQVEERLQKLRLEEKEKLENFVTGIRSDLVKFSQKLTQADKDAARKVCDEADKWLQNTDCSVEGFELRCQQRIFDMEIALEPVLLQLQMLSKKGRGVLRRNFGVWHRPCGLQAEQDQPLDFSVRSTHPPQNS